jgi:hypothetical protein
MRRPPPRIDSAPTSAQRLPLTYRTTGLRLRSRLEQKIHATQSTADEWRGTRWLRLPQAIRGCRTQRHPFSQRLTCTIAEAEVTGLGRTKLYELLVMDRSIRRPLAAVVLCWFSITSVADRGRPFTHQSGMIAFSKGPPPCFSVESERTV